MRTQATCRAFLVVALVSGCGISLDLDPQAPPSVADMDAGGRPRRDAGRFDAAGLDAAASVDDAGRVDDGGTGFLDAPVSMTDAPITSCPRTPCDPVLQCGCSDLTTPSCDLDPGGATFCRAAGSVMRNDACSYSDECEAGLSCLIIDLSTPPMASTGICTRFCGADADCGGFGGVCVALFAGSGLCTKGCDPVSPGGQCPGSLECVFSEHLGGTYCRDGMGFGGEGTTCIVSEECGAGTVCDTSTGFCTALCFVDRDCPGGAPGACFYQWLLGTRELGLCPLP